MSIVHKATLTPTKDEIFASWLATQQWAAGLGQVQGRIGSYRFDDPSGRVGIECNLLQVGASVVHLPTTYRGAPMDGAERYLMGTTEHSVLGTRWVYDACADPVAVRVLLGAALSGASQEPMEVYDGDELVERRETGVTAKGTGTWSPKSTPHRVDGVTIRSLAADAVLEAAGFAVVVKRLVDGTQAAGTEAIDVAWTGGAGRLVGVSRR